MLLGIALDPLSTPPERSTASTRFMYQMKTSISMRLQLLHGRRKFATGQFVSELLNAVTMCSMQCRTEVHTSESSEPAPHWIAFQLCTHALQEWLARLSLAAAPSSLGQRLDGANPGTAAPLLTVIAV